MFPDSRSSNPSRQDFQTDARLSLRTRPLRGFSLLVGMMALMWMGVGGSASIGAGAPPPLAPNDASLRDHLQIWLRADVLPLQDGAQLFRWPDASGHHRDAAPTAGVYDGTGTPPLFVKASSIQGRPAVRFGQGNGLGTPGDRPVEIKGDAAYTLFVVANLKYQDGASRDVIVGFGEPLDPKNSDRPGAGLLEIDRTSEGRHRLDHAGGFKRDALVGRPGSFASFYDQAHLITLVKRPGPMRETSAIFINGEPIDTVASSGVQAVPDIRPRADFSVVLGHAHAVMGSLNGDIAEVALYNAALSTDKRQAVERHLAERYGILAEGPADEPGPELVSARERDHWAFRKALRPEVPKDGVSSGAIDRFLEVKLQESGLRFAPEADRATLLRRVTFDLIGLPTTPEELQAFINDTASDAYQKVVDRLLGSPHFGERWGRHWLDLVGYVDVTGNDQNAEQIILGPSKWRYRDYIIRAFNTDKPWDRCLTEQIAGDELKDWRRTSHYTDADRDLLIATGYLRTPIDDTHEVDLNKVPFRYQVVHDTVQVVGASLFGLTLQCARCHDHKFDPVPARDYYRFMSLFTPALNARAWLQPKDREVPDVSPAEQAEIKRFNTDLDRQLEPLVAEANSLRLAGTNRVLETRLAAIQEPVRTELRTAFTSPPEKRSEAQKKLLTEHADKITTEDVRNSLNEAQRARLDSLDQETAALRSRKKKWGDIRAFFESGPPPRGHIFQRGDHERPGRRVEPGWLSVLCASDPGALLPKRNESQGDSSGRRLEFARWLTEPNGAPASLNARVLMNRFWQQLFGEGLVPTPENFGRNGQPPTHPALLEWLAREFIDSGWRIKHMIRLMVLSSAYRQAGRLAEVSEKLPPELNESVQTALTIDPENRLLWRQRLRRLESEIVRDAILAISGRLDRSQFGPAVPLISLPDGSAALAADDQLPTPTSRWRRSIYLMGRRNFHLPILGSFDQPILNTTCARRSHSSVVLQPLTMLNDAFVLEQARDFAARVRGEADNDPARIAVAFRLALGRRPALEEIEWSQQFLADQAINYRQANPTDGQGDASAWTAFCQMLFNTSEFLYLN